MDEYLPTSSSLFPLPLLDTLSLTGYFMVSLAIGASYEVMVVGPYLVHIVLFLWHSLLFRDRNKRVELGIPFNALT